MAAEPQSAAQEPTSPTRSGVAQTSLIAMRVEPLEVGGRWFVDVAFGAHKLPRKGPFKNADVAKTKADQLIKYWSGSVPDNSSPTPSDNVVLHGKPVALDSDLGRKFVADCTRAGEKLVSDSELQEIYEINPENWAKLDKNTKLINAVRDERTRRVRNGQAAKEAAQRHFVRAPDILDNIMSDGKASARHRIEAAKEIRQVAIGGNDAESPTGAAERFVITFNLGADVERIEKTITPRPILPANEEDTRDAE